MILEFNKSQSPWFFFRIALAFVCSGYEALLLPVHLSVQAMKRCVSDALSEYIKVLQIYWGEKKIHFLTVRILQVIIFLNSDTGRIQLSLALQVIKLLPRSEKPVGK